MTTRTCRRPKLASILIALSLLLGACSKAGGARVNYWTMLAPLVTGTYAGECRKVSGNQAVVGGIVLGADGNATVADLKVNMYDAVQITLLRAREPGGPLEAEVRVIGSLGGADLTASTDGNRAFISAGADGIRCEKLREIPGLTERSFYYAFATILDTPKRTIGCLVQQGMSPRDVELQAAAGVIRLGDQTYVVDDASTEMVLLNDGASSMVYKIDTPDKRTVVMTFNEYGNLKALEAWGHAGSPYGCELR